MAGITCDYCGEGDSGKKGQVQVYNGGLNQMHAGCWQKYSDERKSR